MISNEHDELFSVCLQSEDGVPALLAYKGGQLVGNLIALSDTLGDDFHADDVASLLIG